MFSVFSGIWASKQSEYEVRHSQQIKSYLSKMMEKSGENSRQLKYPSKSPSNETESKKSIKDEKDRTNNEQ